MKKLLTRKETALISVLLIGLFQLVIVFVMQLTLNLPVNYRFLGEVKLANFDGVYYILVAQNGYGAYQQAFFPLFPVIIRYVSDIFHLSAVTSALLVVNLSLFTFLYVFMRLIQIDYKKSVTIWSAIFYLAFPTGFFLFAVYTESLFLALILSSFYFMRKGNVVVASILGCLASATRIIGVFLLPIFLFELYLEQKKQKNINIQMLIKKSIPLALIPLGLISYMTYLYITFNDALLFIHVQPAFGAERSGGAIVFLPQVLWRYFKIITTVPYTSLNFLIAFLELSVFSGAFIALLFAWKKKVHLSYILFAIFVMFFPTLSGTLSSFPRYVLAAFGIFIFLGTIESKIVKTLLLIIFFAIEVILISLFSRGFFVS